MSAAVMLDFAGAFFAGAIALLAAWRARRSVAGWCFVAGMALLACESAFSGFGAKAVFPEEAVAWENGAVLAMALLPGTWLLFSLTYARGNYREFLGRWREALGAAFFLPIILAILCRGRFVGGQVSLTATGQ